MTILTIENNKVGYVIICFLFMIKARKIHQFSYFMRTNAPQIPPEVNASRHYPENFFLKKGGGIDNVDNDNEDNDNEDNDNEDNDNVCLVSMMGQFCRFHLGFGGKWRQSGQ